MTIKTTCGCGGGIEMIIIPSHPYSTYQQVEQRLPRLTGLSAQIVLCFSGHTRVYNIYIWYINVSYVKWSTIMRRFVV